MRIGYLHVGIAGHKESGVTRFGRLLAATVSQRSGVEVKEANVLLDEDETQNLENLATAGRSLQDCQVVQIQFNKHTWGTGWPQLKRLQHFKKFCSSPIATSLHDVYYGSYPADNPLKYLLRENHRQRASSCFKSLALRSTYQSYWHEFWPNRQTMKWILNESAQVITCTHTEAKRIKHYPNAKLIEVIPIYVEQRSPQFTHLQAKAHLGLTDYKLIVVQGFIYDGKGHNLLIAALPHLPANVKVIFAGDVAPKQENYLKRLYRFMDAMKVRDRIEVTGYLTDEQLDLYLMAADIALCPFTGMAASASLSTWIALNRPILASSLPQMEELNTLSPGAIKTFEPITPEALAIALLQWLLADVDPTPQQTAIAKLRDCLSLDKMAAKYLQTYERILGKSGVAGQTLALSK